MSVRRHYNVMRLVGLSLASVTVTHLVVSLCSQLCFSNVLNEFMCFTVAAQELVKNGTASIKHMFLKPNWLSISQFD